MNARWGARTETGLVRKGNEDSYLVQDPLFVVADGMGGHLAGDVASSTAVDVITREAANIDAGNPETLAQVVRRANEQIFGRAEDDKSLHGMGTTCTLFLLDDGRAHIAHVGDSRAYLFRNEELEQLTEDHTLVGRMVREGRLTEKEAEHHPQRSVITRALGVDNEVEVDVFTVNLEDGDRVLLCSDGLSSMVPNSAIHDVLVAESDTQAAADRLVDIALEAGGEDNVTVVVLDIGGDGTQNPQAGRATATAPTAAPAPRGSSPEPPPPPTSSAPRAEVVPDAPARRGWIKTLIVSLIVLALVAAGLFALSRYALSNSWFVGVNEEGLVTIYQGRPEEIAGIPLSEAEEVTSLRQTDLPDYVHGDLEEGIKVDSLEDAQKAVDNLTERARASRGRG